MTIHRSPEQALKDWPQDIHGCLGYYQINPVKPMTAKETLSQIAGLVVGTNTTDDRRNYFKRPVEQDSGARIEVSIMHGGLMPINPSTEQITRLQNQCVSAIYNLEQRYDDRIGAYKFKDGTARLDITGHVLSGWMNAI